MEDDLFAEPSGDGGNESPDLEALLAAAGGGDAGAQYRLGRMFSNGRGVAQDAAEAARWYRAAAEQGERTLSSASASCTRTARA